MPACCDLQQVCQACHMQHHDHRQASQTASTNFGLHDHEHGRERHFCTAAEQLADQHGRVSA